jgi:hypothetical protein
MKTTLELPDELFRQAKAQASAGGISLKTFVTEALEMKLRAQAPGQRKPWIRHFGTLSHLGSERNKIEQRIAEEFEKVDSDQWK